MNSEHFSRNLRRLRLNKGLTQEQLSQLLGVSVQSVSRWECGNTLPDVMLLPVIARLYGVTVDDLYREDAKAYPSYAQRLLAVYEASGRTEDFLAAELEFSRMSPQEQTPDDLRAWGVLYHYMTKRCALLAQHKLEQAMTHPARTDTVFYAAAQQKTALLCDLGRGAEVTARYDRELRENSSDPKQWMLCAAAHYFAGAYAQALEVALEGIHRFPDNAALHIYAGDSSRALKQYDEAFTHWQQAIDLDNTYLDAFYSMGFCHEELGQYAQAHQIWTSLIRELDRRGLTVEREYPAELAENCRKRINETAEKIPSGQTP